MGSETDNNLDFRNVKQSQYGSDQTLKGSFSELQSSLRTYETSPILKDAYTHFDQTVDGSGEPLDVTYYQGTSPATYKLDTVADVAQSLAGTYFDITDPHSGVVHYFWYQVSGAGVDPSIIGAIPHMVPITTNDSALLVAATTKVIIDSTGLFKVFDYTGIIASLNIRQEHFGEAIIINTASSGFTSTDIDTGTQEIVGQVSITYDTNGSPIYQGHVLTGYNYDVFSANFVRNPQLSLPSGAIDVIDISPFGRYDEIQITYPSAEVEVYDYKLATVSIGTVTITYTDATKEDLVSAIYL